MFPAPSIAVALKDFKAIRKFDPAYARLLEKEFEFCRKHEQEIRDKAEKIYKIGCNPSHEFNKHCCNFRLLEAKQNEWLIRQN